MMAAQQVKSLLGTPASNILIQIPAALIPIQFLANAPEKKLKMAQILVPLPPMGDPALSSCILASAKLSHGCCCHLGSEI